LRPLTPSKSQVYKGNDSHTPDWAAIFDEPPILRKQTVHVRRDEIQMGIHLVRSVYTTTLATGAGFLMSAHLRGMVLPFECMFAYLPPRYVHKRMLVRYEAV
jgi:hypothetical protein